MATILEAPPRTTGSADRDFPLVVNWIYKFYETILRSGFFLSLPDIKAILIDKAMSFNELEDDLRFPVQAINPLGAAADPTRNSTTGILEFSGTADNIIAGTAQMPHEWSAGTDIMPHLHMQFPTEAAANTRWKLDYCIANKNDRYQVAYGSYQYSEIITVPNAKDALRHHMAFFSPIKMQGYTESCIINWRLSRLAASDAADNDTNMCALLEFDIHYLKNKDGTKRGTM